MKLKITFKVQSLSDIITNSSSEVFLRIDSKDEKTHNEIYKVMQELFPGNDYEMSPGVFEYLEEKILEENVTNVAFGAHFCKYLENSKIPTYLYPPESLSKNVILTKDKVQITPSSFNLNPIKTIEL